ncbi:OsmC family peroxiredoxin [Haloplanus rubicundus]|uniref:OsmC family peroxiredoxin n=1 Tax=Haloplanus rubicundus TaxID=1547898 RepID=A0A345E666_9EURY|nr:OsmC family protein [Haloplanus rubicundus]AXG07688.1 OsmC family peroxiredoxin [Haloplanus rubicundus]
MSTTTQPQAKQPVHGIDVAAHEEFLTYAEENPEAVQFVLSAVGTDEGRVLHTRSQTQSYMLGGQEYDRVARGYTQHFGGHKEVEEAVGFVDPTDREEAIEVALASLTACINGAISLSAVQAGVDIDELETTVSVDFDPSVFLGLEAPRDADGTPTDMYGDLRIDIQVSGEDLDDDILDRVGEWVNRSPVYNLMALGHGGTPQVSRMSGRPN